MAGKLLENSSNILAQAPRGQCDISHILQPKPAVDLDDPAVQIVVLEDI
jgi:hypothetical protein